MAAKKKQSSSTKDTTGKAAARLAHAACDLCELLGYPAPAKARDALHRLVDVLGDDGRRKLASGDIPGALLVALERHKQQ